MKNNLSYHNLSVEDATELALDSGQAILAGYALNWCKPNNDDDDDVTHEDGLPTHIQSPTMYLYQSIAYLYQSISLPTLFLACFTLCLQLSKVSLQQLQLLPATQ